MLTMLTAVALSVNIHVCGAELLCNCLEKDFSDSVKEAGYNQTLIMHWLQDTCCLVLITGGVGLMGNGDSWGLIFSH